MSSENFPRVFTPATLARRWECSERHVRNLINSGDLPAWRLGGKLLRITVEAVQAFEATPAVEPAPNMKPEIVPVIPTKPSMRAARLDLGILRPLRGPRKPKE